MTGGQERGLWIPEPTQRHDLVVFAQRVLRLDESAVLRLRTRADGLLGAWAATGFGVLAVRVVAGRSRPADLSCAADHLVRGLRDAAGSGDDRAGFVDPGFPMDSGWRGALPPETGFAHIDDVPASVLTELARSGADLAREHGGAHGPPVSLLDQEVVRVSSGAAEVGIPMRCLLALAAMGFIPEDAPAEEVVRVRALPGWLRIDARFGSVFRRRGDPLLVVG